MTGRLRKRSLVTEIFLGRDSELSRLSEIDPPSALSYAEKLTLISELVRFEFQLRTGESDVPRLLRTTACIRKA